MGHHAVMTRMVTSIAALLFLVGVGVAGLLLVRPTVSAISAVDADVIVECTAAAGVDEAACRAWGDAVLAGGSPTTTFEARDVVRLRLDRELLGFGSRCLGEWYLGRYPADVVWSADLDCAFD